MAILSHSKLDNSILLAIDLSLLVFLVLIAKPLWKLAAEKSVLYILISKGIGSLIFLLLDLLFIFCWLAAGLEIDECDLGPVVSVAIVVGARWTEASAYLHLIGLAWNRVHGVYWPLHYMAWLKPRNIFFLCLVIWALSAGIVGIVFIALPMVFNVDRTTQSYVHYKFLTACATIAGILYIFLTIRLVRMKLQHGSGSSSAAKEKDHTRISLVCLCSLLSVLLTQYVLLPVAHNGTVKEWLPDWALKTLMMTLVFCVQSTYCTEEIFSMILLRRFRVLIKAHFLCRTSTKHDNNTTVVQPISGSHAHKIQPKCTKNSLITVTPPSVPWCSTKQMY